MKLLIFAMLVSLVLILVGCADPYPALLSGEQSTITLNGANCDMTGTCVQHSVMTNGVVYHRGMVHQPENEATGVVIIHDGEVEIK